MSIHLVLAGLPSEEVRGIKVAFAARIHITNGHDLNIIIREKCRQVDLALITQANETDIDSVAGGIRAKDGTWNDPGSTNHRGGF